MTIDLIEQVRELNEKRTHVDYYMPHCTCEGDGMGGLKFAGHKNVTESDEKFIALAPQMAEALLEKDRQLQIAHDALDQLVKMSIAQGDAARRHGVAMMVTMFIGGLVILLLPLF